MFLTRDTPDFFPSAGITHALENFSVVAYLSLMSITADQSNAQSQDDQVNSTTYSIFDLSPSEKLQLVEDLWDDLAATAEAIPVHDWQKEELARRRDNLTRNPASGLTWEEVKRRVRGRYGR